MSQKLMQEVSWMEVQLSRADLRLEQPLGFWESTAVVTGEVTLPGGLREETRILAAHAAATPEAADAGSGRVNVRGHVVFHVLYTQGDPSKINVIEASADFMHPCETTNVTPRSSARARVDVQRVEARAAGGRMSLRAEVNVGVHACSREPVEVISAINGTDEVEVQSNTYRIRRTVAEGYAETLLREELPLPEGMQIREALFADAHAVVESVTGGMGRIGLNGQVMLEAAHASTLAGRPLVMTRHSIPFSTSVELSGGDGDLLSGEVMVKDVAIVLQEDGEGRQSLRAEVLLGMSGRSDTEESLSVLEDAYTTSGDDLALTSQTRLCRTDSCSISAAESGKTAVRMPENTPPVRTVLAAFLRPTRQQLDTHAGRTIVDGSMEITLLYMTDGSDAPVSIRMNEPFRVTFAEDVPQDASVALTVTEAEAVPVTSDRVELRYILRLRAEADKVQPVKLVTDGQTVAAGEQPDQIILCFTQPGETLWDISRRYRVPVSEVKALNPDLPEEPKEGQGLVVWRRRIAAAR